jgi:hypothetical protein
MTAIQIEPRICAIVFAAFFLFARIQTGAVLRRAFLNPAELDGLLLGPTTF